MPTEESKAGYKERVAKLSSAMLRLGTGELAELRRMEIGGPGCAAFWSLAAECGFIDDSGRTDAWMRIVKIMAILTPKGERTKARPVHDPKQRFGTALCDGGDPAWSAAAQARPFLSERRLMRFLTEPAGRRAESLERIAQMLATNRKAESGLDCAEIAALLLFPANKFSARDIARAYYRRLDSVVRDAQQEEQA